MASGRGIDENSLVWGEYTHYSMNLNITFGFNWSKMKIQTEFILLSYTGLKKKNFKKRILKLASL